MLDRVGRGCCEQNESATAWSEIQIDVLRRQRVLFSLAIVFFLKKRGKKGRKKHKRQQKTDGKARAREGAPTLLRCSDSQLWGRYRKTAMVDLDIHRDG